MPVPTQGQLHRPTLEIMNAMQRVATVHEIREALLERFPLTQEELAERVPSGQQTRFENRSSWAISSLKRAGLLHSPSRGRFRITDEGSRFLLEQSGDITEELRRLIRVTWQQKTDSEASSGTVVPIFTKTHTWDNGSGDVSQTSAPDEQIDSLYRELSDTLAEELLESVKEVSPLRFERLVVSLLERMGYGEGRSVGGSGDGGIDGIINQDPLGLEKVYIQAKRWQSQVGEPEIRNFSGSLEAKGANKGVFITTSAFSKSARQTAQYISAGSKFIRLIDGAELARLMIDHSVGVITETIYEVKKLDENYFADS